MPPDGEPFDARLHDSARRFMGISTINPSALAETSGLAEGTEFAVCTDDGVRVSGVRLDGPPGRAFVIGHGFCGSRRSVLPLATKLAESGTVYAFDFRGHGSSGGLSTLGNLEALDVTTVVSLARRECGPLTSIVTIGASMGGIAVLREAATFSSGDAVVSISSPARWMGQKLRARFLGKLVTSATGRRLAGRYLATHIEPVWASPPEPAELVGDIEMPMLIVHGAADRFVPSSQAEVLHAATGGRSRLCVIDGYGHAEAGFDVRVVDVLDREIASLPIG